MRREYCSVSGFRVKSVSAEMSKTHRGTGSKRTLNTAIECISADGRSLLPLISDGFEANVKSSRQECGADIIFQSSSFLQHARPSLSYFSAYAAAEHRTIEENLGGNTVKSTIYVTRLRQYIARMKGSGDLPRI